MSEVRDPQVEREKEKEKLDKLNNLLYLKKQGFISDKHYNEIYDRIKVNYSALDRSIEKRCNWLYDFEFNKEVSQDFFSNEKSYQILNKIITIFCTSGYVATNILQNIYNYNISPNNKICYLAEGTKYVELKNIQNVGSFIVAFQINRYIEPPNDQLIKEAQQQKFINQFLIENSSCLIYIKQDEEEENDSCFKQFCLDYNVNENQPNLIKIQVKLEDNPNANNFEIINNQQKNNNELIVYQNGKEKNPSVFLTILNKIKENQTKSNVKNDLSDLFIQFYQNNQELLKEDIFKCDHEELFNEKVQYNLIKQEPNKYIFVIEVYGEVIEKPKKEDHLSFFKYKDSFYIHLSFETKEEKSTDVYKKLEESKYNTIKVEEIKIKDEIITITLELS